MSSDVRLVMAAQRGDAESLGILLERHRASKYAVALRTWAINPKRRTPFRMPSS